MNDDLVIIGVRGRVLALDSSSGTEIWQTALKGGDFVNLALSSGRILASTKGEVFALDPATGSILWHNKLKGLGTGFVTFAGASQSPPIVARRKQQQQAAAAAGAAAAASG